MDRALLSAPLIVTVVACSGCERRGDEWTLLAERWTWWSDGSAGLDALCPECAKREFGYRPAGIRRP